MPRSRLQQVTGWVLPFSCGSGKKLQINFTRNGIFQMLLAQLMGSTLWYKRHQILETDDQTNCLKNLLINSKPWNPQSNFFLQHNEKYLWQKLIGSHGNLWKMLLLSLKIGLVEKKTALIKYYSVLIVRQRKLFSFAWLILQSISISLGYLICIFRWLVKRKLNIRVDFKLGLKMRNSKFGYRKIKMKHKHIADYEWRHFHIATHGKTSLSLQAWREKHKARILSATQRILVPLATSSQQKVDRDLEVGETVENKTGKIFNKNPTSYFIKEEVTDAKILWALDFIISYLLNSCQNKKKLFLIIFKGSKIAELFACGSTKCFYMINFGLAPYFQSILDEALREAPYHVRCFDESHNKSVKKGQMDMHIRYIKYC